jgi:thiamine biosynthesis lipoprotein
MSPSTLASAQWRQIGVTVRIVVTDPDQLASAEARLREDVLALDLACSRFRDDSEIIMLQNAQGAPTPISPLLTEALVIALTAAQQTDGDLDPTMGRRISELGYDRTFAAIPQGTAAPERGAVAQEQHTSGMTITLARTTTWRDVVLDQDRSTVSVPAGVILDLGATAKAFGSDRSAHRIAEALGCGVLVSLGGDIAVAGPAPDGGWAITVQEQEDGDGPKSTVAMTAGGIATSSTTARRWVRGADELHHVLDPRTGMPVRSPWRTVTVAAVSCTLANTLSTAAIIRGEHAAQWLTGWGVPARLVDHNGTVTMVGGWPTS